MKCILALSGGMDSTTLLAVALHQGLQVSSVSFTYGSKHNQWENEAARMIAAYYKIPFLLVDLTGVMASFKSDLLLTGGEIPEGHYEAKSMEQTVVPARNIIFASILAGLAWSQNAGEVWLGVHAGDHAIYEDCREGFITAMDDALQQGTGNRVSLKAPFLTKDKGDILEIGLTMKAPYKLTRTCYKHQAISCGKCGSCRERLYAFKQRGLQDPIDYEFRDINPERRDS